MNLIDVAFVAFDALGLLVHLPAVVMIAVYVIIKTNRGLVKIWMVAANRLLHLGELLWLVLYHVWHVESLCCWVEKSVLGVVRVEGSAGRAGSGSWLGRYAVLELFMAVLEFGPSESLLTLHFVELVSGGGSERRHFVCWLVRGRREGGSVRVRAVLHAVVWRDGERVGLRRVLRAGCRLAGRGSGGSGGSGYRWLSAVGDCSLAAALGIRVRAEVPRELVGSAEALLAAWVSALVRLFTCVGPYVPCLEWDKLICENARRTQPTWCSRR